MEEGCGEPASNILLDCNVAHMTVEKYYFTIFGWLLIVLRGPSVVHARAITVYYESGATYFTLLNSTSQS